MKKSTMLYLLLLLAIPTILVFIGATDRLEGQDATPMFVGAFVSIAAGLLIMLASRRKNRTNP